jgi:hypothetical protein
MSIEVTIRSHLRGGLASHLEHLLTEQLRSLPEVTIDDDPLDYEVFFAGGIVHAEGYGDPTFILVTVATRVGNRDLIEQRIPKSLAADDRSRLIARLSARFLRYQGVECGPPANVATACVDTVRYLDDRCLASVRRARSNR